MKGEIPDPIMVNAASLKNILNFFLFAHNWFFLKMCNVGVAS